jgi:hypothetical protein
MLESADEPARFSRPETQQIRNALGGSNPHVACPKCDGLLTVSHPVDGPQGPSFFVGCKPCRRNAVVTGVPGMWQPGPRG